MPRLPPDDSSGAIPDFPVAPRTGIVIEQHGGPEALRVRALPPLPPTPDLVRVRVTHVALNHLDLWVRKGVPGHSFDLPRIPGSDVAGVLLDPAGALPVGTAVVLHPSWGCGTCAVCLDGRQDRCKAFRIRGENTDGGCVTELAVPAWQVLAIPPHLAPQEAVALPLTLLTAWHMLVTRARLGRGERVLVQAGGSGVGVMAIQIALIYGCEVHATASTPERRALLEGMGVRAWPYDAIGVREVDVVVESVGEATWAGSIRALAWGGRLVCCGATAGPDVRLNLRAVFFKQLEIVGSTMGSTGELLRAWQEVTQGRIRPVVDRVLPLSRIADAHAILEARGAFGKIVLEQDLSTARPEST
ncbi:MAG: zinc-binding dehydrogenase [Pseudomonadota bacterium]|nr:zinc-binding dehydrogenase [Pseudomonadota bacterium]